MFASRFKSRELWRQGTEGAAVPPMAGRHILGNADPESTGFPPNGYLTNQILFNILYSYFCARESPWGFGGHEPPDSPR
jgi:hypothetical protein